MLVRKANISETANQIVPQRVGDCGGGGEDGGGGGGGGVSIIVCSLFQQ